MSQKKGATDVRTAGVTQPFWFAVKLVCTLFFTICWPFSAPQQVLSSTSFPGCSGRLDSFKKIHPGCSLRGWPWFADFLFQMAFQGWLRWHKRLLEGFFLWVNRALHHHHYVNGGLQSLAVPYFCIFFCTRWVTVTLHQRQPAADFSAFSTHSSASLFSLSSCHRCVLSYFTFICFCICISCIYLYLSLCLHPL